VGAGPADILPAYSWGSTRSRLVEFLGPEHYDVRLEAAEFDRIVTWIDLNAPYYPTYASAYPDNLAGRSPLNDSELARLETLTGVKLRSQASFSSNAGPQVSFDRPERSPCLAALGAESPGYVEALALITQGQQRLAQRPEADQAGFVASEMDQWREANYLARREAEERNRAALRAGQKVYDR
jgi:hypothetical protein